VLRNIIGSDSFWEGSDAKKLKFVDAPSFSEKFTYPCQIAIYANSEMGISNMDMFMQTDDYRFRVSITWETKNKAFTQKNAIAILESLKMVVQ